MESGVIEQLIEDKTLTPFPTIFNTERPDVASGLMEGRVAILVDGTPFVLLVPALFIHYLQAAEDYYQRSDFGLLRLLRVLSLFIALLGPSLYIAITTFHQEMLPTPLIISIAAGREGVPFPAFIEALIMETTFEILREERVEAVVAGIWLIAIFAKILVYYYSAISGLKYITGIKNQRLILLLMSVLLLLVSLYIFPNSVFENEFNSSDWIVLMFVIGVIFPLILLLASFIKSRMKTES